MNFPKMIEVGQVFDAPLLEDVEGETRRLVKGLNPGDKIKPGDSVAITAGSRGIADIVKVLRAVVIELNAIGAKPFILPSMGSHGSATAEGQKEIMDSYGITEESMGVPVRPNAEVVGIGHSEEIGVPVLVDKIAYDSDWVVVVNRIKPHTDFNGEIESGLMKMMVIGLGNHKGALSAHKHNIRHGYQKVIPDVGRKVMKELNIAFGVGIIENVYDQTARVVTANPEDIEKTDRVGLIEARQLMARLPFDFLHLLIVDELGKNVSGAGLDPNVIGRIMFIGEEEPTSPKIYRIFVRDLTEETHGNATGIGLADFTTQRLVDKLDKKATMINCVTGGSPEKARIPIHLESDREVLEVIYDTIGEVEPENARVVWIKNTLEIGKMYVSTSLLDEVKTKENLEILGEEKELIFDADGNLVGKWS